MKRLALALLVLFAAVLPATAAEKLKSLDIGTNAQVWFQEDHTVPMVAITIALPAGSVYDPANKAGLAAFTAYMFNEGAGTLTSEQYQSALATRAIQLSMTPDRDTLVLTISTLSSNVKEAIELVGLALQKPRFDADAVERVRAQMMQSLLSEKQDPNSLALRRFYDTYFAGHPYAHSVNGDEKGIAAITGADMKAFARAHWVRGGTKISVAGDVREAAITALLKAAFGPLPGNPPPARPPVKHVGGPPLSTIALNVPQSVAIFGMPGLMRADPDYLAGYVASYIVGGGDFSTRLTNEVRVKRGLTYGISLGFSDLRGAGLILGQVATKRDAMNQSLEVTRSVLTEFAANGPTLEELNDAKTYITGSFPLAFASNVGIAAQLNAYQRAGLPIEYVANRNAIISALTLEDVRRAAARLFDPKNLTVVVVGGGK